MYLKKPTNKGINLTPPPHRKATYIMENSKSKLNQLRKLLSFILIIFSPIITGSLLRNKPDDGGDYFILGIVTQILTFSLLVIFTPRFFVEIPTNHCVCVEIKGKFLHFMCGQEDREKLKKCFEVVPEINRPKDFKLECVIVREDDWFFGLFVKFFNLHFKSYNPFSKLRNVKIFRRRVNPQFDSTTQELSKMIGFSEGSKGEESTEYLRLEYPRSIYIAEVEFFNQIQINLVLSVTGVYVFDWHSVFYVYREVNGALDLLLKQAVVRYMGLKTFDNFMNEDYSANPLSDFNRFMRERPVENSGRIDESISGSSSISGIGQIILGSTSISEYELSKSQEKLKTTMADREIAIIESDTRRINAEAQAEEIKTTRRATLDMDVANIKEKGDAEAQRIEKLGNAINDNREVAGVLEKEFISRSLITVYCEGPSRKPAFILNPELKSPRLESPRLENPRLEKDEN